MFRLQKLKKYGKYNIKVAIAKWSSRSEPLVLRFIRCLERPLSLGCKTCQMPTLTPIPVDNCRMRSDAVLVDTC